MFGRSLAEKAEVANARSKRRSVVSRITQESEASFWLQQQDKAVLKSFLFNRSRHSAYLIIEIARGLSTLSKNAGA